jgi:hypothetical protein
MPGNCGLIGHIAGTIVSDGWNRWSRYANDAINDTHEFLEELDAVTLTAVPVDMTFTVPASLSTPFAKPDAPDAPDLTFHEPDTPADVLLDAVSIPVFEALNVTAPLEPSVNLPQPPTRLAKSAPSDAPVLSDPDIPVAPTLTVPDSPVLRTIILPTAPDITLPTFDKGAPEFTFTAPSTGITFAEELYSSHLLDTVTDRVTTMLAGGTGLPDAIWRAIWEKNTEREDQNGVKAIREATEEWASRGFSLPPGALTARVAEVRQGVAEAKNTVSRETAIQQAQMEVENIRFAVTQALALEDTLLSAHLQRQARALQAQQVTVELAISLFNARVQQFNSQLEAFRADSEVYRLQLEGEMKELEAFRLTIDSKRVETEINRQDVEIYTSRLQALNTQIQLYRGEIEAVQASVDVDKARIDTFKTRVEAYSEEVQAKTAEFQAYAEQIKGEMAKVDIYDSTVKAYASRIEAWRSGNAGKIDQARLQYDAEELKIKQYASRLDGYRAKIAAEASRIESGSKVYDGQSRLYTAEIAAESARVESEDKQFALGVEKARAETSLELEKAKVNIAQLQRIAELEQEQLKMMAQVNSSLAAGAMSAVSLSAGVNEQASNSTNCSTTYSL